MSNNAYVEKFIGELKRDTVVLEHILADCLILMENNSEAGRGSCLLDGIQVLCEAAIAEYKKETERWVTQFRE